MLTRKVNALWFSFSLFFQAMFCFWKIHDVLRSHPSKDLRELLGTDTFRLMHAACSDNLVPPQVAFRAIRGCPIDIELRCELLALLRACTRNSEAV
jgi:hypothetical protein